jgi:hypothetical protein
MWRWRLEVAASFVIYFLTATCTWIQAVWAASVRHRALLPTRALSNAKSTIGTISRFATALAKTASVTMMDDFVCNSLAFPIETRTFSNV